MEFAIEQSELLAGLYLTQGIVDRRTTIPILGNVLLSSSGDGISVAATDQEVAVRRQCVARVKSGGSVTTGARKLYEMVREIPAGDILIRSQENNWIEVSAGRSRFRLVGLDAREFPAMPQPGAEKGAETIRVSAEMFAGMIECTAFALSVDEARPNLNGIYMECLEAGRLRLVATDGHRLAMVTRTVDGAELTKGVIIPRKGVMELRKVLEGSDGSIELTIEGGLVHARRESVLLSMRLVEGEFPDYNQVIPPSSARLAVLSTAGLLAGLRRVSVVSIERTRGVKLQLEGSKLELSTMNPDVGEAAEEMEADYDGEPVGIGFNARYLMDVLGVLPSEAQVEIGLTDDVSPGVVRPCGDTDYCYIIMPMRL